VIVPESVYDPVVAAGCVVYVRLWPDGALDACAVWPAVGVFADVEHIQAPITTALMCVVVRAPEEGAVLVAVPPAAATSKPTTPVHLKPIIDRNVTDAVTIVMVI
jgi:hypothetical protein